MGTINYNEKDLQAPPEELESLYNRLCRQSENIYPDLAERIHQDVRILRFFHLAK